MYLMCYLLAWLYSPFREVKTPLPAIVVVFGLFGGLLECRADEVKVAVAANFTLPAKAIAQAFEHATAHKTQLIFAATGALYVQIANGAPFDVLLAADTATPLMIENNRLGVKDSSFTYARGKIALYSQDATLVDQHGSVLFKPAAFRKLAIANPKTAPYGAAALQSLTALGVLPLLQDKIIQGESISHVFQFVSTGNAELGIVALSQLTDIHKGAWWLIPEVSYEPILQNAVLLNKGKNNEAAQAFLIFLKSEEARRIIVSYGYSVDG